MQILNIPVVERAINRHRDAEPALRAWLSIASLSQWTNLYEVRQAFPNADGVKPRSGTIVTIFNIRKNKYRMLTIISYRAATIYICDLLTHAEYDKEKWKVRL